MSSLKSIVKFISKEIAGLGCRLLCFAFILKFRNKRKPVFVVLNYHNFSKYNNYKLKRGSILETDYAANFEKQIKWLAKHFGFVTPESFFNHPEPGIQIFLTFDDGYKDNYDIALPVLAKYNVKAGFFVVTALPDSKEWLLHDQIRFLVQTGKLAAKNTELVLRELNRGIALKPEFLEEISTLKESFPDHRLMMNWKEIKALTEKGFIVGSHTHTHNPLKFLSPGIRKEELQSSMEEIASHLGGNVIYFAYPNGLYDDDCSELLKNNEIHFAFTTQAGFNELSTPKHKIKRIGVNASDSIGVLLLKLWMNR